MRRLVLVAILVLVLAVVYRSFGSAETATGTLTLPQPAPNVGERAPTFDVPSEEGGRFALKDRGVYVLAFWSTLNRQSNDSRAGFQRLARKYSKDGISFAVVYINSAPTAPSPDYEVLRDRTGRLAETYNVKRVPRLFLVEDGKIHLVQNGYYGEYASQLEHKITDYLKIHRALEYKRARSSSSNSSRLTQTTRGE